MASTFSGRIDLKIAGTYGVDIDLGNRSYQLSPTYTTRYSNGTGADQAQAIFTDVRTVSASSSENLTLSSMTGAFGETIAFINIKSLTIYAHADNVNNVVIGNAASHAWVGPFDAGTDTFSIKPGGTLHFNVDTADGYTVSSGSEDVLKVANSGSGTGVTYDVIIVGDVS